MTERGMQVKSDIHKAGWEGSEFPILCETCLGENPYVRMTRTPHGDECKICERPFTIFRWKPGPRARFKKTQCCQTCARQKNVCQTCILDLTYGLPVKVRDTYLSKQAKAANQLQVAKSFVGREYQAQNAALQQGPNAYQSANLHQGLVRLARSQPNYRRNLPIVCTFFSRGECNRGNECPYRHEMPTARDHPMYTQNIKDRFYGTDDPVANAMLKGASKAGVYVDPPTSTVRTLWMSPVDEKMTDKDLRDKLYAYGEITSIKLKPDRGCAFVEFSTQAQAVAAYKAVYSSLKINDVLLRVSWARERRGGGDVYGAFLDYTYRQLSKDAAKGGQQQPAGGQGSAAAAARAGAGAGAASGGGAAKASSGASASTGAATTTTSTAATTASASSASSSTAAAAGATTTAAPASAPAPAPAPAAPASGGFGGFGGYSYQFPAYMPPPPGYSPGMQLPAYMGGAAATAGYGGYGGYAPPPGPPGARTGGSGPMRHARNAPRHHPYMYPSMNPASMGAKSSRKK